MNTAKQKNAAIDLHEKNTTYNPKLENLCLFFVQVTQKKVFNSFGRCFLIFKSNSCLPQKYQSSKAQNCFVVADMMYTLMICSL